MNHRLKIFLSIALGLVLMILWLYIVDIREMLTLLKNVKISFVFPLVIFFTLTYVLRSLRWKIILSPIQKITLVESFVLCMINYFVNFIIPVHAGEVAKSAILKKMKGTPLSRSLISVYVDKVMDFFPILILFVLTPFLKSETRSISYLASLVSLSIFLILIVFLLLLVLKKDVFLAVMSRILFFLPAKFRKQLTGFFDLSVEGLSAIFQSPTITCQAIGLTILALITHCVFMWLFFYCFGVSLPLLSLLVGYLLLNGSFILPSPPGFVGTLELTFLFIFSYLFGYDKNLISAVAASSHVLIAILFSLFGITSAAFIGAKLSSILKMPPEDGTKQPLTNSALTLY